MDRTEVVTSVAGDLHATELAIDAAITTAIDVAIGCAAT